MAPPRLCISSWAGQQSFYLEIRRKKGNKRNWAERRHDFLVLPVFTAFWVKYGGSTRYFAVELELTFMGHISGSTALRVVPVLFPPVSMGCWDEVNFKPYKRCHKLRVMANILCFSFESDPGHLLFPLTLGDDATLWATSLCRRVWKICQIILHRKETFNKLAF